jgi:hypothetical protein
MVAAGLQQEDLHGQLTNFTRYWSQPRGWSDDETCCYLLASRRVRKVAQQLAGGRAEMRQLGDTPTGDSGCPDESGRACSTVNAGMRVAAHNARASNVGIDVKSIEWCLSRPRFIGG